MVVLPLHLSLTSIANRGHKLGVHDDLPGLATFRTVVVSSTADSLALEAFPWLWGFQVHRFGDLGEEKGVP
jgi:hypothetical protein